MEEILSDSNITLAQNRVIVNIGVGGVDGVSVEELNTYMSYKFVMSATDI